MTKNELPEFDPEKFAEAARTLGKTLANISFTFRAQALLGHALSGKHDELQKGLKAMSAEDRRRVLTAAQVLAGSAYALGEED